MSGWENFFIAEVGASAALTGLIFVGVSINLTRILSLPRLPNRALEALIILLAVLVVSSLQLVPGQPLVLLGLEVLLVGLALWSIITSLDISIYRKTDPRYRRPFLSNMALSQLAVLPYVVAGIIVLAGNIDGLYWLVPAVIFSFIKAVTDAWVLLVEINR
jgi:modulator of FtsH protease